MRFGDPTWLYGLLLIVPLVVFLTWSGKRSRILLERFVNAGLVDKLVSQQTRERRHTKATLLVLAITLMIFALSQPRLGFQWEDLTQVGVDVIVALDVSNSMLAADIKPSRLERAKHKVADLLKMLDGDRFGLVAFAGTSYLQCPLTLDYGAAEIFLNAIDTDLIPLQGTAIGHALRTAVDGFSAVEKKSKAIILITDGEDHEGEALQAAEQAQKEGVRIFVISIGQAEGAPIPDFRQGGGFLKDERGEVVLSRLNETGLKQIALMTGGAYVRSVMGDMDLNKIYLEEIKQKIEKRELRSTRRKIWQDRFQWVIGLALILLMVERMVREKETPHTS